MKNAAKEFARQVAEDATRDAKQNVDKIVGYMAEKVRDDWVKYATHVMDQYYNDYDKTKKMYKRTGELRDNTIVPVLSYMDGEYEAGVMFDIFGTMDHGLEDFDEVSIFQNFIHGHHGNRNYTVPNTEKTIQRKIYITTPSAKSILDSYYKNYESTIDQYYKEALLKFL